MPIAPAQFREAMSRFATGVTVLTTRTESGTHETLTANAVTSVSLSPVLLAVGVQQEGRWLAAARTAGTFAVNVLSEEQEAVSRWCSSSERHDLPPVAGSEVSPTSGLLVLEEALAVFECAVWAEYPAGDHALLLGEVQHLRTRDGGRPLLFHASRYSRLAPLAATG